MERTNQSTSTEKVDEAVHNGWKLKFTYSTEKGTTKPKSVTVNGSKEGEDVAINGTVSEFVDSITFYKLPKDATLTAAIVAECNLILGL